MSVLLLDGRKIIGNALFMAKLSRTEHINRITRIITAWSEFAPEAVLGAMTLDQFVSGTNRNYETRVALTAAQAAVKANIAQRMLADAESERLMYLVINSIAGHPDYGTGSGLWRALGYQQSIDENLLIRSAYSIPRGWQPDPVWWLQMSREGAFTAEVITPRRGNPLTRTAGETLVATTVNGRPAARFGINTRFEDPSFRQSPALAVAGLIVPNNPEGTQHLFSSIVGNIRILARFSFTNGQRWFQVLVRDTSQGSVISGVQVPLSATMLRTGAPLIFIVGQAGSQSFLRLNGTAYASPFNTFNYSFSEILLGAPPEHLGMGLDSTLAELMIFSSAPTTNILQRIEGYLAWNWAAVEVLPVTHPYAFSRPL